FGEKKAVSDVSLKIKSGIYGLLGANGAGKTTLMRMICGLLEPTNGKIKFNGKSINEMGEKYFEILGYQPQCFGYYPDFTGIEYIGAVKGLSRAYTVERAKELFHIFQLLDVKNKKIKTYSGGMIQRLGFIQAVLNDPQILVLDEPTSGLDPKQRVILKNYLS